MMTDGEKYERRRIDVAARLALDHAFCARLPAAEAPAPEVAPSYPYLASYAVFLLSFATVRLLSSFSTTRRNNEHEK